MPDERKYEARIALTEEQAKLIDGNEAWFKAYIANALAAEWQRQLDDFEAHLLSGDAWPEPRGLLGGRNG